MNESQSRNVSYLSASRQDMEWGLTVSTVGDQVIRPHSPYPSVGNHPKSYTFTVGKGRVLNEYQLIYITEGSGVFESVSCPRRQVSGGQMIMLFPDEWHDYHPDEEEGWSEHWIGFNGFDIDHLVEKGFFDRKQPVFDVGFRNEILYLYRASVEIAIEQRAGFQQILSGIVHLLFGYTFSISSQSRIDAMNVADAINAAKKIMSEHLCDDLNVEQLAKEVNMGYSKFRASFKQYTSFAPKAYLENLRLQKAKELLLTTDMNSQEIAFACGFNTPYYFSILFRKYFGITPLEYRKRYKTYKL